MKRRKDYSKFKEILEMYQIKKFYHFTDRSNIESIIKNGGLYSWSDCIKKGIYVEHPGGSELSHELDNQQKLAGYTRISICKRHPMMYYAMNEGRIANPVILEIDTDILYQDGNLFSDKNAVRTDAQKGEDFSFFQNIHFETALKSSQFEIDEGEKEYYQAEILVKNHIPLHYILNISDFVQADDSNENIKIRPSYTATISEENPTAIIIIHNQSYPTGRKITYKGEQKSVSQVLCDIINQQLNALIAQNIKGNTIQNNYQVSIIGYGDYCYSSFDGNLKYKDFVQLRDLKENPISFTKTVVEKKTRRGIVQMESEEPVWIRPRSDGNAYLHKALERAKHVAEKWISSHLDSFPPIMIHISCFGYNGAEDSDIIQLANEIKSLHTKDGNVIFINLIFSVEKEDAPVNFPTSIMEMGKSIFGEMYFLMSSQLPLAYNTVIKTYRNDIDINSIHTGVAFKTPIDEIPKLLYNLILANHQSPKMTTQSNT